MALRYLRATVAVLLLGAASSVLLAATPASGEEQVVLAEQDLLGGGSVPPADGGPLLTAEGLVPGYHVERCVVLAADDVPPSAGVRLGADGVTGALAQWLRVRVEAGTGTAPNCADFAGTEVFEGSLAELAEITSRGGVDTGWRTGDGPRTFRLTTEVADDDRAGGATTTATLTWVAVPTPTSPGEPSVPSAAAPPTPAARTDDPARGLPAAPAAVELPEPSRVDGPATARTDGTSRSGTSSVGSVGDSDRWRDLVLDLARTAWLFFLLVLVLVLYLAIQDRLDRNDPKLALAPVHPDPLVRFPRSPS